LGGKKNLYVRSVEVQGLVRLIFPETEGSRLMADFGSEHETTLQSGRRYRGHLGPVCGRWNGTVRYELLCIFDVQCDGETWTFNSNWGQGRVGNFELHKVSPTEFDGSVGSGGEFVRRNRWIKVD
jgi:hypothetical protein